MDAFKIGEDHKRSSAFIIHDLNDIGHISHNDKEYWIYDFLFEGIDFKISKESHVGIHLVKLIKELDKPAIKAFLEKLVLQYTPVETLKNCIENIKKKAYEQGKEDKIQEIKTALMLTRIF